LIGTLASVAATPLLVENSSVEERTYLFSFQSTLSITMAVVGGLIGGFLPDLFNQAVGYATGPNGSAFGYRVSLGISISLSMAAFIPVLLMKQTSMRKKRSTVDSLRVWKYKSARTILKFMIPTALIGFGAGFVIPLVNIFFNLRYNASSEEVGAISALGNITLGLGILLTPVLSKKITRVKFIVICQYLSMPFIMLTAFSPNLTWAAGTYIVRTALMNVAGPIGTTFQMESVAPEDRAATNGIMTMTDQIPRALTARISGVMMARGDFFTEFPIMAGTYVISTSLYYAFFRKDETKKPLVTDKE
jgi:predicted MFS family arabinose efflux permease